MPKVPFPLSAPRCLKCGEYVGPDSSRPAKKKRVALMITDPSHPAASKQSLSCASDALSRSMGRITSAYQSKNCSLNVERHSSGLAPRAFTSVLNAGCTSPCSLMAPMKLSAARNCALIEPGYFDMMLLSIFDGTTVLTSMSRKFRNVLNGRYGGPARRLSSDEVPTVEPRAKGVYRMIAISDRKVIGEIGNE